MGKKFQTKLIIHRSGADPGFDQGGAQIVTGLKLPFWGLNFVEFWCWGLIFGDQGGGPRPLGPPPGSTPVDDEKLNTWSNLRWHYQLHNLFVVTCIE